MKEFYGMPLIAAASAMFMLAACDDSSSASDDAVSSSSIATVANSSSESIAFSSSSEEAMVSSSSEEAMVSSSSSEIAPAVEMSSSSETAEISSSSEIASSSSAMTINYLGQTLLRVPDGGAFSWTGADSYYRVETGLDDGSGSSGDWFVLEDSPDGGKSSIVWPVPKCDDDYGDYWELYWESYIDFCGGLCGDFALRKGTSSYNPFVGIGFNVAGEDDAGNATAADASAWGGFCVAYISTENALLQLGLSTTYANPEIESPAAELPKSAEGTVVCVPWSKFTKSLNGETSISAEEASKKLVSVRFVIQGEDGAEGKFNFMSIGSYVEQ